MGRHPLTQRMGLLSKIKASTGAPSEVAAVPDVDPVQAARARARRRLVGAAVLLGVGVIGFPILFETQPRPVPVDVPIDIPKKEGAPSLPLPPPRVASAAPATARVASGVIAERPAEAKRDIVAAAPRPTATAADSPAVAKPAETSKPAPQQTKPPAASAPTDDGQRAKALLEGKPVESKATQLAEARVAKPPAAAQSGTAEKAEPAPSGRFVVQIAAYADMNPARDMRQRLEKLGLKSYLQTVEINGATRIRVRVGPYASRDEAEKAAETIKAAGLPAAVLTL
jgi:DedD protein